MFSDTSWQAQLAGIAHKIQEVRKQMQDSQNKMNKQRSEIEEKATELALLKKQNAAKSELLNQHRFKKEHEILARADDHTRDKKETSVNDMIHDLNQLMSRKTSQPNRENAQASTDLFRRSDVHSLFSEFLEIPNVQGMSEWENGPTGSKSTQIRCPGRRI